MLSIVNECRLLEERLVGIRTILMESYVCYKCCSTNVNVRGKWAKSYILCLCDSDFKDLLP